MSTGPVGLVYLGSKINSPSYYIINNHLSPLFSLFSLPSFLFFYFVLILASFILCYTFTPASMPKDNCKIQEKELINLEVPATKFFVPNSLIANVKDNPGTCIDTLLLYWKWETKECLLWLTNQITPPKATILMLIGTTKEQNIDATNPHITPDIFTVNQIIIMTNNNE